MNEKFVIYTGYAVLAIIPIIIVIGILLKLLGLI